MRTIIAAVMLAAAAIPAGAGTRAKFLGDGTYATEEGCAKLKAIAAGGPRNLNTVPETLDQTGYSGWEYGCTFTSVKEVVKGRTWRVGTRCSEGPEHWSSTDAFERRADGGFTVTNGQSTTKFVRCASDKGK